MAYEATALTERSRQHALGKNGQRYADGAQGAKRSRPEARGKREAATGTEEKEARLIRRRSPVTASLLCRFLF